MEEVYCLNIAISHSIPGIPDPELRVIADTFDYGSDGIGAWLYREGELVAAVEGRVRAWHTEALPIRRPDPAQPLGHSGI